MYRLSQFRRRGLRATPLVAALVAAAACQDGTGPGRTPARLELSSREVAIGEGGAETLAATAFDPRGRPVAGVRVEWSSSDTSVVSVDSAGVVRGRRSGTGFVFAALQGSGGGLRDSAQVVVRAAPTTVQSAGWGGAWPDAETLRVYFRVLDGRGRGFGGAEVRFSIVQGNGTLASPTAVTNDEGYATAVVHAGSGPVEATVQASVPGGAQPAFFAVRYLTGTGGLAPDPLVLTPVCTGALGMTIRDSYGYDQAAQQLAFTVEDPSVVELRPFTTGSANRSMSRQVIPRRIGETRVAARWLHGRLTDTATVKVVVPAPTSVSFGSMTWDHVRAGGSTRATARVLDQCGAGVDGPPVTYDNLDPQVIVLGPVDASGYLQVTGLRLGTGRVVARAGSLSDTLRVDVVDERLLPADTTVAVGSAVAYSAIRETANGEIRTLTVLDLRTEPGGSPTVSIEGTPYTSWTVKALAPGSVELIAGLGGGDYLRTRITVVAPPGS